MILGRCLKNLIYHTTPEEALKIAQDLKSKKVLEHTGVHLFYLWNL